MTDFDVVIIGGGVGGLTLALKLAQANIHVLVIEKANQPGKIYKGELLQPKSLKPGDYKRMKDEGLHRFFEPN
ncbi:FAD-dependent oxidoreductase [Bacillus sp. A301a_S52]|jgi:flavin-dependent dehydrogenase|nr:FAD-dependent oxidoreductase [Bacillus sp. A301a_S52]